MNLPWLLSELIGTFALTFIGAGSICLNEMTNGGVGLLGIAVAHGLALAVMISAVAPISGGKINPAVTLGLLIGGKIDAKTAALEILFQVGGAILAAICLTLIFPTEVAKVAKLGTPQLGPGISFWVGVFTEAILTFFLVFTVYATAIDPRGTFKAIAGFGIGLVILFDIIAFGGVTGAAMNPARAFGPALISSTWADQLVYWIGPILGGLIAGILYSNVYLGKSQKV